MLSRALVAAVFVMACGTLVLPNANAFQHNEGNENIEILRPAEHTLYLYTPDLIEADAVAVAYETRMKQTLGDGWRLVSWNQYSEVPRIAEGPGIVVAPQGLANATDVQVEQLARSIVTSYADLFGIDNSDLELAKISHGYGRWGVIFTQHENGIQVLDSSVLLALHDNGKFFGFGSSTYEVTTSTAATVERSVARALARSAVPHDPTADHGEGPEGTVIVPVHTAPGQVEFHLAHHIDVQTSEPVGVWRTYVDAHSGDIFLRENQLHFAYEGNIEGDVEIVSYCDGITPGSPYARMNFTILGVGGFTTDDDGNFDVPGNIGPATITTSFDGPHFHQNCFGCTDASFNGTISPDTPLTINFDEATYRADERDAFYFANQSHMYIEGIDPTFTIASHTIQVNENFATCNAFYNLQARTLTFVREGGGCANTGRVGDIVAHEYGHGVNYRVIGGGSQGQQGLGEGNADILGTFISDNSRIGIGFASCNGGLGGRNCDNTLIYPDNVIGQPIHSAGRVICGFNWDVRRNLEEKMGAAAGKAKTAELWHFGRDVFGFGNMTQPDQVDFTRWVDDDNGDLTDGTPNWDEICDAATAHGFTCPVNPNRIAITHTPLTDIVDPTGPYSVQADFETFVAGNPGVADNHELYYSVDGGAFTMVAMSNVGGDTYEGLIPQQAAGTYMAYYLRADLGVAGLEEFDPEDAPAVFHDFFIGATTTIVDNDMEIDPGWTVTGDATQGGWELADPNGVIFGLTYTPEDDHTPDPGTMCWITENADPGGLPFDTDLTGETILTTGSYDFTDANAADLSLWVFTYLPVEEADDHLTIEMSIDGGSNWQTVERVDMSTSPSWQEVALRLTPFDYTFSNDVVFRFVAEDASVNHLVECLVDDFTVDALIGSGTTGIQAPAGSSPLALQLGTARPNPFNPATSIAYTLPNDAEVRLAIYDVRGRTVRHLVEGRRQAGEHVARWDGVDDNGVSAASGVYYYKLSVGDWSETRSMVLLK